MKKDTVLTIVKEIRDLLKSGAIIKAPEKPVCSKDGRFTKYADGSVLDNLLHLIWYPTLPTKMNWEDAKKECAKTGCRLPTRVELESLLDLTKHEPAIDKEIFPETKFDDYYWTATEVAGCSGSAWFVFFRYGYVSSYYKDSSNYVRPCRSSQ